MNLLLGGEYQSGLTKENLFNALFQKYPNACQDFCNWIDEYKKKVNWDMLFNVHCHTAGQRKFHDLPYSMQSGILMEYMLYRARFEDANELPEMVVEMEQHNWAIVMAEIFAGTEVFLNQQKNSQ